VIDVVRLLRALRIEAEPAGDSLWAKCPLPGHPDNDASWHIDFRGPKQGWHHCFGCKAGGGPVDLVMDVVGITYGSARAWIESRGLDVDDPVALEVVLDKQPDKYGLFRLPPEVRHIGAPALWPTPFKRFAAKRGLTNEQIERWSVGYATEGSLAYRLVFPIHNDKGEMWSYSARSIVEARAKYLTATKDEHADHGAVFGALHWPPVGEREVLYVAEGVLNALAIERVVGTDPRIGVAALDGSQLLDGQALALGTFERVVLVSDPDLAGDGLAEALAPLRRWRSLQRATIPKGQDANSLPPEKLARILGVEPPHNDRDHVRRRPRSGAGGSGSRAGRDGGKHQRRRSSAGSAPAPALPHHPPRGSVGDPCPDPPPGTAPAGLVTERSTRATKEETPCTDRLKLEA
jgi:hypothetical protein